jgi:hypothetical protein
MIAAHKPREGPVKFFRLIIIAAALGVLLAVPSFTAAATDDYTAYVACGYKASKPPATSCPKTANIGAFFRSNNASVTFKTCVTFPNGQTLCTRKSTAEEGSTYVNKLTIGSKGRLTVRWKVDGVVVARYSIKVT